MTAQPNPEAASAVNDGHLGAGLPDAAALLDLSGDAIYLRDFATGAILSWNRGAQTVFGYTPEEALGRTGQTLLETDFPLPLPELQASLEAAGRWTGTLAQTAKDGRRLILDSRWDLVRDTAGRPRSVLVTSTDVTASRVTVSRFESQLERNEEKFRSIFERANLGVALADPEGRFVDVNPALSRMLGYGPHEMEGLAYLAVTHPDDRPACEVLVRDLLAGRIGHFAIEKRYLRKDGSALWVNAIVAAIPGEDGRPRAILGMIEDISQRKATEQQLREAREELEERVRERTLALTDEIEERRRVEAVLRDREQTLNEAQQLAHMGNWVWDVATNTVTWSDELYRIYGQTPQAFGATFEAFLGQIQESDRARVQATILRALEHQEPYAIEEHVVRPDGELRVLSSTGRPILDAEGRVVRLQGTCLDITAYKRVEAEIRRLNAELELRVADRTAQLAAANQELEAFSYSVSHDLRAPLRSIDGFSQALLEDYEDKLDAEGQDYLRRVRAASQRMATLIDDMLQLSRLTRGELHMGPVDLSAIAAEVMAELRRAEPDRRAEVAIAPGLVTHGDSRLLRSVLENLLGNAWKFTRRHEAAQIAFGRTDIDGQPAYFVRDDGAGFDMAYVDKLFKPFSRLHTATEFEGTGIGLATVQRIVHRHGGRVWADSRPEGGATFYFTLQEGRGL